MADREHAAVVIAALTLNGRGVAQQRGTLLARDVLQLLEVKDDPWGLLEGDDRFALGEQFVDGDAVEIGQFGQPLNGDSAVPALVGPDDDRLPAALGLLLDAMERQPLLGPDRP